MYSWTENYKSVWNPDKFWNGFQKIDLNMYNWIKKFFRSNYLSHFTILIVAKLRFWCLWCYKAFETCPGHTLYDVPNFGRKELNIPHGWELDVLKMEWSEDITSTHLIKVAVDKGVTSMIGSKVPELRLAMFGKVSWSLFLHGFLPALNMNAHLLRIICEQHGAIRFPQKFE